MARRTSSQNELIKCEFCGEMYSVTYKHCPFCNEDGTGRWDDTDSGYEDDYDYEAPRAGGGKRLAGGSRGGGRGGRGGPSIGRIIGTVLSLALIVAAVCIVISIVKSMLDKDPAPAISPSPAVSASVEPGESQVPAESQPPQESQGVLESVPPETAPVETPQITPAVGSPTGFTLNREDFTFDAAGQVFQMKATFTPAGTTGDITWKSSDPNVASVSWNGVVTSVSQGTATLTATVAGAGEKTCIVRCNFKDQSGAAASQAPAATANPDPSGSGASGLSLNREDFTLSKAGETFRMIVKGTSSAVTWASSNTGVATIASDGTVTAVGKGTCNVTATVDGVTLKCIVRCSF